MADEDVVAEFTNEWTADRFLEALRSLQVGYVAGQPAPHKPLLILVALRNARFGRPRLSRFGDVAPEMTSLLRRIVSADVKSLDPAQPFWNLRNDGFWEVVDDQGHQLSLGADPSGRTLEAANARGGFREDVADVLIRDADLIGRASELVATTYFAGREMEALDAVRLMPAHELPRAWWVNQGATYRHEREGGYVWAPVLSKSGTPLQHHTNVSLLEVGDIVLHYANGAVRSLSRVVAPPERRDRPAELGESWQKEGHYCALEYHDLIEPILRAQIAGRTTDAGPFQGEGDVKQIYLSPLSPEFFRSFVDQFADRLPPGLELSRVPAGEGNIVTDDGERSTAVDEPEGSSLAAIVADFADRCRVANLNYGTRHDEMIRSFVVSLATKGFVILTGLSGSGKTRLALAFGEWLGPGRCCVVATRPDWTSPDALLGFENQLSARVEGNYAWSVPDVLAFMLEASREPTVPHLLVLDEMNLAHVERYFADVLSGMESRKEVLPNLERTVDGEWRPVVGGPARLSLPSNLLIVGTVNIDETTYMFSPKVLDRANTLEFRIHTDDLTTTGARIKSVDAAPEELVRSFHRWATLDLVVGPPNDVVRSGLVSLHQLLARFGREFGHRTFADALRFASLFAAAGGQGELAALDLQVLQKALPKFHGSMREIAEPLRQLGEWCFYGPTAAVEERSGFDPVAPPAGSPALPLAFDKIQRMMRRLRANHFVGFAE